MVDTPPPAKNDEQYPLLMVNRGSGDGGGRVPSPPSGVWNVTSYTPKNPWFERWPEYLSTCWMTFILLGISFLVFYVIGMVAYKNEALIIVNCNDSRTGSDVYYHNIIPRGSFVPFIIYSDYLANMALSYPSLRFNMIFLMDDSFQNTFSGARQSRLYPKVLPYSIKMYDEYNKQEIKLFQKNHHNVNITIMPLSKYMAMTPLRFMWRSIPAEFLLFYARVFSVWMNGGVGLDIVHYNNQFMHRMRPDPKVTAILKKHNDRLITQGYGEVFAKAKKDDTGELLLMFNNLIQQILNETHFLFNRISQDSLIIKQNYGLNEPFIRKHRNKRDFHKVEEISKSTAENLTVDIVLANTTTENIKNEANLYQLTNDTNNKVLNDSNEVPLLPAVQNNDTLNLGSSTNKPEVDLIDLPQLVLFYDISLFSDNTNDNDNNNNLNTKAKSSVLAVPQSEALPQRAVKELSETSTHNVNRVAVQFQHDLAIEHDGLFVAVSSRLHPYLANLVSAGCKQMRPRLAIQETIIKPCTCMLKEDLYCNNIYLF